MLFIYALLVLLIGGLIFHSLYLIIDDETLRPEIRKQISDALPFCYVAFIGLALIYGLILLSPIFDKEEEVNKRRRRKRN